jgi:hypothetical protein
MPIRKAVVTDADQRGRRYFDSRLNGCRYGMGRYYDMRQPAYASASLSVRSPPDLVWGSLEGTLLVRSFLRFACDINFRACHLYPV